jgi:transposase InsO family protein
LANETAKTAIGFFARARAFSAAHGIGRITRVITDNGSCHRAAAFTRSLFDAARHQRTRPFTPRHNGKVERCQRILAEELRYARNWTFEAERAEAISVWAVHYNYHRPHTALGNLPPITRCTNVSGQYIEPWGLREMNGGPHKARLMAAEERPGREGSGCAIRDSNPEPAD